MIGVLINPKERTIGIIAANDASEIADYCGWQFFDIVRLFTDLDMFVDDEGLLCYPNPQGYFSIGGQMFAGSAVVLGRKVTLDGPEACSLESVDRVIAWLTANVVWRDTPDESEVEPRIEVITWDEGN